MTFNSPKKKLYVKSEKKSNSQREFPKINSANTREDKNVNYNINIKLLKQQQEKDGENTLNSMKKVSSDRNLRNNNTQKNYISDLFDNNYLNENNTLIKDEINHMRTKSNKMYSQIERYFF